MNNLTVAILVMFAISWGSGVSADGGRYKQSPESLVHCVIAEAGTYYVVGRGISSSVNTETCIPWESTCNACIESLESQGCTIVDLLPENIQVVEAEGQFTQRIATYELSCKKP